MHTQKKLRNKLGAFANLVSLKDVTKVYYI